MSVFLYLNFEYQLITESVAMPDTHTQLKFSWYATSHLINTKIKTMPIKEPDNINWYVVVYLFFVTLLGSLASYCYHVINGNKFNLMILIAQIFISIFAGALVVLAASYFNWQFELAGGIAGLAGWSGATLIKALEERLLKKARGNDNEIN